LTGVAVNVTDVPEQIVPEGTAATVTDGVTLAFTVIATGILVAVDVVVHDALLVITTVTWSLLTSVVVVNVDAVCPATGVPLTCHA